MRHRHKRPPIHTTPIVPHRVRTLDDGFAFIEHRFLQQGFFAYLTQDELVLYLLLVLAADSRGISSYSSDAICSLCDLSTDAYLLARTVLIAKDLIAYDGRRLQVLSLPLRPVPPLVEPLDDPDVEGQPPTTIRQLIQQTLGLDKDRL